MYGPLAAFQSYIFGAFDFGGRASRSEYWWANTLVFGLIAVVGFVDVQTVTRAVTLTGQPPLNPLSYWSPIVMILTFLPNLSSMVRRLHDSGRSGWWILIQCIPIIGPIVLLGMLVMPSKPQINQWGAPRDTMGGMSSRETGAQTAGRKGRHVASPLDSYAVLLQGNAEPSAEEAARRKQEVHEYFMRNVSRGGGTA